MPSASPPEQSVQATAKLDGLFQQAETEFTREDSANPDRARENLTTASIWLPNERAAFMPWELCPLTPAQESVTWKKWIERNDQSAPRAGEYKSSLPSRREEIEQAILNATPLLSLYKLLPDLPRLPEGAVLIDAILPLQRPLRHPPAADPGKLPGDFQTLHPAQFKLALLLIPELAARLARAANGEPAILGPDFDE